MTILLHTILMNYLLILITLIMILLKSLLGHFPNKWDQKVTDQKIQCMIVVTVSKNNMGGVVLFTEDNFRKLNGYSNSFIGWGGEDDDFASRVKHIFHSIKRRPSRSMHAFQMNKLSKFV